MVCRGERAELLCARTPRQCLQRAALNGCNADAAGKRLTVKGEKNTPGIGLSVSPRRNPSHFTSSYQKQDTASLLCI